MTKILGGWLLVAALAAVLAPDSGAIAQSSSSIVVSDQQIRGGRVIVEKVVSAEDGWVDIHGEAEIAGNPGSVLGYAPVKAGENSYVVVPIDTSRATSTLYAVLHEDKGTVGVYESPGPDAPVVADGRTVDASFKALSEAPAPGRFTGQPGITVADQPIQNGAVIVGRVMSAEDGWVDIHGEAEIAGNPGSVLGYAPVKAGENNYVVVPIDTSRATSTLYAVLHEDKGTVGVYESPGPDAPVVADGRTVDASFKVVQRPDTAAAVMVTGSPPGATDSSVAAPRQPAAQTSNPTAIASPVPNPTPTAAATASPTPPVVAASPTAAPSAVLNTATATPVGTAVPGTLPSTGDANGTGPSLSLLLAGVGALLLVGGIAGRLLRASHRE